MSTNIKQVIILRKDLNMRKGKMVAQGAHASMAAILKQGCLHFHETDSLAPALVREFNLDMSSPSSNAIWEWLNGSFTKITLSCDSEEELLALHEKAKGANLLCSLIQDNGLTEFNGVKTYTAVAIGPDFSEKIDLITSQLKLL
jgi:PTH2 family peptidyl-tRNA hydrolase